LSGLPAYTAPGHPRHNSERGSLGASSDDSVSSNCSREAESATYGAPTCFDFPILHFSETDVRLLQHPFAPEPSVIFREPLLQTFSNFVPSIGPCDRFNMVQQIPDLGIVVAASQKGRVGIFALTEVEAEGLFFRLDQILPFKSQEKYGHRPLCPLLGIAVGPVESHLVPIDEVNRPYEPSLNEWLEYDIDFSIIGNDEHEDLRPQISDAKYSQSNHKGKGEGGERGGDIQKQKSYGKQHIRQMPFGRPFRRESWHGIEYSRRYRLFLMYSDHTIMHYEIFYDWPLDMLGPHGRLIHETGQHFVLKPEST